MILKGAFKMVSIEFYDAANRYLQTVDSHAVPNRKDTVEVFNTIYQIENINWVFRPDLTKFVRINLKEKVF